jgi:hypothetical protein
MTDEAFLELRPGDVIASEFDDQVYIVTAFFGQHAIAIRAVDVTHPSEWRLVSKVVERQTFAVEYRPRTR